ncbi:MAG: ribonuclease III [Patescibacteria group bacterium]
MDLSKLEKSLDYKFKNKDLLKEALTHRSYLNENPNWGVPHNERLEFLGDAVLELAVTEELYNRFPDQPEGQLTALRAALVNYQMMSEVAREVGLEQHILLSRGESKDTGKAREVILANAIEAVIGAVYLDSDYKKSKKLVVDAILGHLDEVIKKGLYKDSKSSLQEKLQASKRLTPTYKVLSETGPDHAKIFVVGVYIGDELLATGQGASKQDAEVAAARAALEKR